MKAKDRCRCYINATYNSKTAWRTGRLPKPCPIHDKDLLEGAQPPGVSAVPAPRIPGFSSTPEGQRQMGLQVPQYFYHYSRTENQTDRGLKAYEIREKEAASTFGPGYQEAKYIWLSKVPLLENAVKVDITKLRNEDMRFTGQAQGHMLHRGDIPEEAIVRDKPEGTAAKEPGQAAGVEQLPLRMLEQQLVSLDTEIKALEAMAYMRAPRAKMQARQRQIERLRNAKTPVLAELRRRYAEGPRLTR